MTLHLGSSEFESPPVRMHIHVCTHLREIELVEVEEYTSRKTKPFHLTSCNISTMLKFLAREKSNVDKIEKLRRKAADTEGSLRCIQLARATWTVRQSTISKSSSQLEGYCKGGFITNL